MTEDTAIQSERKARLDRFRVLEPQGELATRVPPGDLRSAVGGVRVFYGGRGIWYDAQRTKLLMEPGITVGVLHTGRHYPDDLAEDGIIYHYPSTQSPGKDQVEVEATKNAAISGLPIFVVTQTGALRDVHFGWIEDWDDTEERFLISFGIDEQPESQSGRSDQEWIAIIDRPKKRAEVTRRERDHRFAFRVLKRYENACAACELRVTGLIDAAHIIPVAAGGSNDPRNGLPLCPTHHRAYDRDDFTINPYTLEIVTFGGVSLDDLRITNGSIGHLKSRPHEEALGWRWDRLVTPP